MVVIVRTFGPDTADDAGAKALEARASQHSHNILLTTVIKVHLDHLAAFDSKARKFEGSIVLLAVDTDVKGEGCTEDGFVCGCVCIGIKGVWLRGSLRKVGYLFDMRVHEEYQRRKIGMQLYRAAENALIESGAAAVYLSVNSTNKKARAFYDRNGYAICSQRALLFTPLLFVGLFGGTTCSAMRSVSAEEMVRMVDGGGSSTSDLALSGGFGQLLQACPGRFLEGWVAEARGDGEEASLAALTLWDGDGTTSFKVERLFLTPATWRRPFVQVSMLVAGCSLLLRWGYALCEGPLSMWSLLSGALLVAATAAGALLTALVRFTTTRQRERARLIAPVAQGPRGAEMLMQLVTHAKVAAKQKGFAITIANLDIRDPRLPAFSGQRPKSGRTLFMAKWLGESSKEVVDDPYFDCDNFFDPRDMY